jgi:hypothetical protein
VLLNLVLGGFAGVRLRLSERVDRLGEYVKAKTGLKTDLS